MRSASKLLWLQRAVLATTIVSSVSDSSAGADSLLVPIGDGRVFRPNDPLPVQHSDLQLTASSVALQDGQTGILLQTRDASAQLVKMPFVAQINQIVPVKQGRLAVLGMANGSVHTVTLVDVATATVIDNFRAYWPVVSPDGRYIAYVGFFTPHFAEEYPTCYRVYDTTLTPSENRNGNPSGVDPSLEEHPVDPDPVEVAGMTVYPTSNMGSFGECRFPDKVDHYLSSKLYWTDRGEALIFADTTKTEFKLVLVNTSALGFNGFEVKEHDLSANRDACKNSYCLSARVTDLVLDRDKKSIDAEWTPGELTDKPRRMRIPLSGLRSLREGLLRPILTKPE